MEGARQSGHGARRMARELARRTNKRQPVLDLLRTVGDEVVGPAGKDRRSQGDAIVMLILTHPALDLAVVQYLQAQVRPRLVLVVDLAKFEVRRHLTPPALPVLPDRALFREPPGV